MARRIFPLVPLVVAALPHLLAAQLAVRAPDGTLSGVVRDSMSGLPVGYALLILVERDQRVFANEAGRFSLVGLTSGTVTLRVQQIGYRAIRLRLEIDARPGPPAGAPAFAIQLVKQAYLLPEIVVEGDVCSGTGALASGASETIVDEAFKNAERLLSIQRDYPYLGAFQRINRLLNAAHEDTGGWVDTVRYDSRNTVQYRRGRVLERTGAGSNRREVANYFTTSDIAREEFRKSHCFWYAGRDSMDGSSGYRIEFAPTKDTKRTDWAGSLLIDSVTMRLLRSEAHLTNLPKTGTTFGSAACLVLYKEIAPTLVQEFQARCTIGRTSVPPTYVAQRWLLIELNFIGRRPDSADARP